MRRARSVLNLLCGVALLATSQPVYAQTTTTGDGGAGSFIGGVTPPALGDPNQVVPGAGGDTSGWTNYQGSPNDLIRAGEANAPGNEYLKVIGGGSANAARYDLNSNDDWLKSSMDLVGDPGNVLGDLGGNASSSCKDETKQTVKTTTSLYTCESGTPVTNQTNSCTRIYKPEFDTDYVYECKVGNQWRAESKVCEPERIVTVDEDYVYACKTGTVWTHTPASCERKRIVVVDEDYMYGCVQTWNGSGHAPNAACNANGQPGCSPSGGRVCAAPSGLPSSYTCQQGYSGTQTTEYCAITQDVRFTETGLYSGQIYGNAGSGNPTIAMVQSHFPGCTARYTSAFTTGIIPTANFEVTCSTPQNFTQSPWTEYYAGWYQKQVSNPNYAINIYTVATTTKTDTGERLLTSCPTGAATNPNCRFQHKACVEGAGTRVIDGVSVYRACWRYEEVYACGSQSNYAGCNPPAGMAQSGERCIATNASGVCTGVERTYIDPTGGCSRYEQNVRCEDQVPGAGTPSQVIRDVVSDTWDNGCNALAGNGACVKQGEVVIEGNATKTINGLPVTRNPWTVREDYICSSSSTINSCSPFTGCIEQSSTCMSRDRAGNCTAYDKTYRCENPVNNGGTPIETPRDVVGEYWTDPCATNRNDPSCSLTKNEVLIGNETRIINGLSVTRDPWKRRETWTCNRSSAVNTCAPVASCALVGQTCAGTDPNGACSIQLNRYRCENPVTGEKPVETPIDWTGGQMHDNTCPSRGNGACKLTGTTCTQPGTPRMVNGVLVTPPCWEETDTYTCEVMGEATNNCSPPSGCQMKKAVCLDDVPDAQCRSWENVYECKTDTVTNETKNSCQTKFCVGDVCIANEDAGDTDMPDALAALLIAQMAGQDYEKNLTIFKGESKRCRKAVLGFRNCCKDSGWGVDMGLTQCSAEEKDLMQAQEAKSAHYIGTYCSQKSFFGICTEKAMRYCTFGGTLAKIVQREGRPQIGKSWGTPSNADCSGFTVEEFQKLDLTNVDFSEFTDDLMNQITTPDTNSTIGRLQQSIEGLMGSGSPGFGEVNEAGNGNP